MRKKWTQEQIDYLRQAYEKDIPRKEMAIFLDRSVGSIISKAMELGIKSNSKYNNKYKAIYQNSEWLLSQVLLGKEPQDIATELGVSRRVIEKWLYEKNHFIFREVYKLTPIQRQIVIWGTLGDGHIDKRNTQPLYIESHSIEEKDYLFWKYEQLKPMFNNPPTPYKGTKKTFNNGKSYNCKDYYRMSSKVINDLYTIRDMSKIDKIKTLDELGLSLYLLDDGSRSDSQWELCVAMLSQKEKEFFINECKTKFDLTAYIVNHDNRYIKFNALSSRKIDDIILSVLPNDLDIIYKKIFNHRKDLC
jgi:hypothetical protein